MSQIVHFIDRFIDTIQKYSAILLYITIVCIVNVL